MDKYTTLANKILKENFSILEEDNELLAQLKTSPSFGDFLRSITGKTRKDILDSASYARLYVGNRFGITSAANDESNPEVLLSKFLTKLGDFANQGVKEHRPRLAETEEFKKKYGYDEYLRQEQERRDLMKAVIKAPSGPEKDKARKIQRAFRNTSEYAEAMRAQNKEEDQAVKDFHNRPIERGELVNDGSDKYTELANLFYDIQQMRSGNVGIEDQEIRSLDGFFSDKEAYIEDQEAKTDMASVEKGLSDIAATANSGAKGSAAKLLRSKAQKAKSALDRRAKAVAAAIPAYNEYTKKLEAAYKNLEKQ
jgi:hypothetical protein